MLNPSASPHANRLARPPRVPEIFEEDEAGSDDGSQSPTPLMCRKKSRSTSSSSLAPAPAPTVSPPTLSAPIVATIQVDINESLLKQGKKRISRRQSGLINVTSSSGSVSSSSASSSSKGRGTSPLRPPSPAFGSPLRRDAALAEEEEEYEAIPGQRTTNANEEYLERATSKGKKKRTLTQAQANEVVVEDCCEREKRSLRDDPEIAGQRLQDVTNAFGSRVSLPPLDTNISGMAFSVSNPVLFMCWQIRIVTEVRQILTQTCLPRRLLVLPARRFRLLELRPHRRTFPLLAIRVHHRYPSRLPIPIPQQWAVSAACARASITLSLSSTRTHSVSYVPSTEV